MKWLKNLKSWQRWGLIIGGTQFVIYWSLFLLLLGTGKLNSDAGMILAPLAIPSLLLVYMIYPIKFSSSGEDYLTFIFYHVFDTGIFFIIGMGVGVLINTLKNTTRKRSS
jgi:hypothetical protein